MLENARVTAFIKGKCAYVLLGSLLSSLLVSFWFQRRQFADVDNRDTLKQIWNNFTINGEGWYI